MSDYDEFLAEIARERKNRIKNECNKGNHNWSHGYHFATCSRCGIDQEEAFKKGK